MVLKAVLSLLICFSYKLSVVSQNYPFIYSNECLPVPATVLDSRFQIILTIYGILILYQYMLHIDYLIHPISIC